MDGLRKFYLSFINDLNCISPPQGQWLSTFSGDAGADAGDTSGAGGGGNCSKSNEEYWNSLLADRARQVRALPLFSGRALPFSAPSLAHAPPCFAAPPHPLFSLPY